jgi:hypothetical protein
LDPRFPAWYLAATIEPKDEFLRKRWQAVEEFASSIDTSRALALVRLFHGIPAHDANFLDDFSSVIQKYDAAFTPDGRTQELSVLAGATLAAILKVNKKVGDASALAVVSYNCHGLGSKGSAAEIIKIHRDYLNTRAEADRGAGDGEITMMAPLNLDAQLVKAEAATPEAPKEAALAIRAVITQINHLVKRLATFDERQQHFREESNVLWWLMSGHSRDLGRPFDASSVCVIAGKELADLSASAVGPYAAKGFLDRVLRMVDPKSAESVQISSAVNALDTTWRANWASGDFAFGAQDFCPIALAVREAARSEKSTWQATYKKYSPVGPTTRIGSLDLAHQVYEESLLLRFFGRNASGV